MNTARFLIFFPLLENCTFFTVKTQIFEKQLNRIKSSEEQDTRHIGKVTLWGLGVGGNTVLGPLGIHGVAA